MRKAILHIGHSKTGSSYIAAALEQNIDFLNTYNIDCPPLKSGSRKNGMLIDDERFKFQEESTTLLSHSVLFHWLIQGDSLEKKVLRKLDSLSVILYMRDPMEWMLSGWAQDVKMGSKQSLNEYCLARNGEPPSRVLWWIEASKKHGFSLTIYNYTNRKETLLKSFFGAFLPADFSLDRLSLPNNEVVNRSLSLPECQVQRVVNQVAEGSFPFLSQRLMSELPDIEGEAWKIDKETFDILKQRYAPFIERINEHVGEADKINFGSEEDLVDPDFEKNHLSPKQIEIIADGIKAFMTSKSSQTEDKETVNLLRDTAIKIATGKTLDMTDALTLMKRAGELRPSGQYIIGKINEWSKQLKG